MRKWVIFVGLVCGALNGGNANARLPDSLALSVPAETGFTLDRLWSSMESRVETVWDALQPEMEKQRKMAFAPTGPADSHWAEHGVDMEELLARAPGGAAANVLYSEDVDGPVIYVHDAAVLAELTKEWRQIAARDFAQMEGPAFVSLLAVTPAHLLVSQEAWKRVGNGFCPRSSQPAPADRMALYRDAQMPFDADSDRDALVEETAFSIWTAVSRTTTPRVCWTYREVALGIYESRSFDPEGRPLAHLDKGTKRMRIVPLSDLRAMLTAHAEPLTLQGSASAQ